MKSRAKVKRRSSHARPASVSAAQRSRKSSPVHRRHASSEPDVFAPMETGPDQHDVRSPLSEGEARNDRLAALEVADPNLRNIPET